jgi:hypothetical protein
MQLFLKERGKMETLNFLIWEWLIRFREIKYLALGFKFRKID